MVKFLARHPVLDLVLAVLALAWSLAGWPGPVTLTATVTAVLVCWRLRWPGSFSRFIGRRSGASGGAGTTSGTGWP